MAVAIDASSPAKVTGVGGTRTTVAFTTPANVMLVAAIISNGGGSGSTAFTHTVSGAGLTWTKRVERPATGPPAANGSSYSTMWTATSATALTSVTVSDTTAGGGTGTGRECMLKVFVLTGAETSFTGATNGNASTTGTPTASLTPLSIGSLLLAASADWAAVGPALTSYTPSTGQTADAQDWVSGQYGGAVWHQTALTASLASATLNLSGPSGENWQECVLEVRPTGAVTATPFRRVGKRVF